MNVLLFRAISNRKFGFGVSHRIHCNICANALLMAVVIIAAIHPSVSLGQHVVVPHEKQRALINKDQITVPYPTQDYTDHYKLLVPRDMMLQKETPSTSPANDEGPRIRIIESQVNIEQNPQDSLEQETQGNANKVYNIETEIEKPENAASRGSSQAHFGRSVKQHKLPLDHLHRILADRDLEQTRRQFRNAADNGDPSAQRAIATMYRYGLGGTQDDNEARRLYQMAANQGDLEAKLALAELILEIDVDHSDQQQIRTLFDEAASSGMASAQVQFGLWLQRKGENEAALHWYSQAANREDLEGIFRLGTAYRDAIGTDRDLDAARKTFGEGRERRLRARRNGIG